MSQIRQEGLSDGFRETPTCLAPRIAIQEFGQKIRVL
jgi:hypothetical protein